MERGCVENQPQRVGLRGSLRVVLRTHPRSGGKRTRASVLECGGPPPLFEAPDYLHGPAESASGLAHSKTSRTSTMLELPGALFTCPNGAAALSKSRDLRAA